MHSKSYTVIIDKPISEVFEATLDPGNTPLWIDDIVEEQASESPAKLGTLYRNRGAAGDWSEYSITAFEKDVTFTLSRKDGAYHVRYSFKSLSNEQTEFEYFEWADEGTPDNPMPEAAIQKLKQLIES